MAECFLARESLTQNPVRIAVMSGLFCWPSAAHDSSYRSAPEVQGSLGSLWSWYLPYTVICSLGTNPMTDRRTGCTGWSIIS